MQLLDAMGSQRLRLDGQGVVSAPGLPDQRVAFEFVQLNDGELLLAVSGGNGFFGLEDPVSFAGSSAREPWSIRIPEGWWRTGYERPGLGDLGQVAESIFACPEAVLVRSRYGKEEALPDPPAYIRAEVAIINAEESTTFRGQCGTLDVTLRACPVAVVEGEARKLRGGSYHTHDLVIEGTGSLSDCERAADSVQVALTLDSGRFVNRFEVAFHDSAGSILRRLRSPATRHRTGHPWGSLRHVFELDNLIQVMFSRNLTVEDDEWIASYVEANNRTIWLEARALVLVSIVEGLLSRMDEIAETSVPMSQSQVKKLRRAMRATASATIEEMFSSDDVRQQLEADISSHLNGIEEASFSRRLTEHLRRQRIGGSDPRMEAMTRAVVRTRNRLVHTGRFVNKDRSDHIREYKQLLWIALSLLARRFGYQEGFSTIPSLVLSVDS